ncbi:cytochrome P450 [Herbidospora cretacea]|uniref:cytochrome P450 n=1 Tax=Herbidospora cretacea TaxID=28444 RepID=UPI000773BCCC|nr:cytochrome P450 [Herbidospora cretacea]
MSVETSARPARPQRNLPLRRLLPMVVRAPLEGLAEVAREARGEIVRLDVGPFRPYLLSHPDHLQQALRGDWTSYLRKGMFWKPIERLLGDSVIGEGPGWADSRKVLQPLFTSRYVSSLTADMAATIDEGLDELTPGVTIDAMEEMNRIVTRAVISVLFGDRISPRDAEVLGPAYATANTSFGFRIALPFVPDRVPLPGDRKFMGARQVIDDVIYPLIRQARTEKSDGPDIISALVRARDGEGRELTDVKLRDDLASIYGAAAETTAVALTWLWPILHDHPEVAAKLYAEIDEVTGDGPVDARTLPKLRYLTMVLREMLRLYPSGWAMPRMVVRTREIGGVTIRAGSQVLISPYVTHRLDDFWPDPLAFRPERFDPHTEQRRSRYVYLPFGAGPHQCLGQHLFYIEAPLLIAGLLKRFRPELVTEGPFPVQPAGTLRSRKKIEMILRPVKK